MRVSADWLFQSKMDCGRLTRMANFIIDGAEEQDIKKLKAEIIKIMQSDPSAADIQADSPNAIRLNELHRQLERLVYVRQLEEHYVHGGGVGKPIGLLR